MINIRGNMTETKITKLYKFQDIPRRSVYENTSYGISSMSRERRKDLDLKYIQELMLNMQEKSWFYDVQFAKIKYEDDDFWIMGDNLIGMDIHFLLNVSGNFGAYQIPVIVLSDNGTRLTGPEDCLAERNWNEAQKHTRLAELERKVDLLIAANDKLAAAEKLLMEKMRAAEQQRYEELIAIKSARYRKMTPDAIAERDSFEDAGDNINERYMTAYRAAYFYQDGIIIDPDGRKD